MRRAVRHRRTGMAGVMIAISVQACLPSVDPICQPCTPGGCGPGLVCSASSAGMICAPVQGGVEVCSAARPDAGAVSDAGQPSDASVDAASDAGEHPLRCPEGGADGLRWLPSAATGLCFLETEVTVRQFEPCAASSTCAGELTFHRYSAANQRFCNLDRPGRSDHPMNCVDEVGAAGFCASVGGRLPTRNEWTAEASDNGAREYPWGDEPPDCTRAVMWPRDARAGCDTDDTFETCSRPAGNSVSGLCDMAGNVFEITSDTSGSNFVMCGGSLLTTLQADFLRTDVCSTDAGRHDYIGFRCVTDALP